MPDLKELPKISKKHYDEVANMIYQELKRRQELPERQALERTWKEIDRQVDMIPEKKIREKWHPEFELPYQANALEVINADVNQARFPTGGAWFTANAQLTNDFLEGFEKSVQFLSGDNPEMDKFNATQEDVNGVVQAALMHAHAQYNFEDMFNQVDAEAIKYGTMCVRVLPVKRPLFQNQFGGVTRTDSILPVVSAMSVKNYYPDDIAALSSSQGVYVSPMEILTQQQRYIDLVKASSENEKDMSDLGGGWIKSAVQSIEAEKQTDLISLVECEGDISFGTDGGKSIFVPNLIVLVAYGKGLGGPTVIRVRENPMPFTSVFSGTYFKDKIGVYGTSPLMKGEAMQKAAQVALESMIKVSALQAEPPVSVNNQDPNFLAEGINVSPRAIWSFINEPKVHVIGDLVGSTGVFTVLTKQYEDTTGVHSPRTGGQTKSHQTAFAVGTEKNQAQSRTVKYVRSSEQGLMRNILHAELAILSSHMTDQDIFVPEFQGYITASKEAIPENVTFLIQGSSTASEDGQKTAAQMQALQGYLQLQPQLVQQGGKAVNPDWISKKVLKSVFPDSDVTDAFLPPSNPPAVGPDGQPIQPPVPAGPNPQGRQ